MARARANALMAAVAIERDCGIETIPHVTPRDTSIMGLESQLLGAHAEGVRNVLAVTGDPPEIGDYPGSRGVYEVDSIGLSQIVSQLNRGEDYNGKGIDAPTSFFLGVAVNPSADDLETEVERFHRKIEAGAQLRDDAGALRPLLPRPLRGADRRLAGAGAARDLLRAQPPARRAAAQRGAGDRRARGDPAPASSRPARTRAPRASRWRASSTRRRARRSRAST